MRNAGSSRNVLCSIDLDCQKLTTKTSDIQIINN